MILAFVIAGFNCILGYESKNRKMREQIGIEIQIKTEIINGLEQGCVAVSSISRIDDGWKLPKRITN